MTDPTTGGFPPTTAETDRQPDTLKRRVIPCLDVKAGRVVKGVNFVGLRDMGDPVELASRYEREGADEIVFLDIAASAAFRSRSSISSVNRDIS